MKEDDEPSDYERRRQNRQANFLFFLSAVLILYYIFQK